MAEDTSLRTQFFQDSLDILSNAEEIVLQLEQHGSDKEQVHSLFRLFHTLKGNSNMVGEMEISSLTHALESEYDQVRNGKRELDPSLLQTTFEVIDLLNAVCQEGDSSDYTGHMDQLTQQLSRLATGGGSGAAKTEDGAGASAVPEKPSGAAAQQDTHTAEVGFSVWKPILRSFYTCRQISEQLPEAKQDLPDLLMDLGMETIELRSLTEDPKHSPLHTLAPTAVYLEKFSATLAREQFDYNDISYELLYVLLNDFKRSMWQQLYLTGAIAYKKIATMEEMNRIEQEISPEDQLWVVELAFASSSPARSSDFFSRMVQIKRSMDLPLVYISPHSQYYRKASDLLDQALGGFTRIAGTIEDGVKTYILSEE